MPLLRQNIVCARTKELKTEPTVSQRSEGTCTHSFWGAWKPEMLTFIGLNENILYIYKRGLIDSPVSLCHVYMTWYFHMCTTVLILFRLCSQPSLGRDTRTAPLAPLSYHVWLLSYQNQYWSQSPRGGQMLILLSPSSSCLSSSDQPARQGLQMWQQPAWTVCSVRIWTARILSVIPRTAWILSVHLICGQEETLHQSSLQCRETFDWHDG